MRIKVLHKGDEARWDKFVDAHVRGTLYHTSGWRLLIQNLFGHDPYYLYVESESDEIAGVLPLIHINSLLFGSYMVSMPYLNYGSAIGESTAIEEALMDYACGLARDKGVRHIEYRDVEYRTLDGPVRTDKATMILDLPSEVDTLWKALGSKCRAQIKRPLREGPQVKSGGIELLDDFYSVFAQNMRDLGTPVYSKAFFKSIIETYMSNNQIIVVYLHDQPVGVAFLLSYKKHLEVPWAASLRSVNSLGVNMLLYWEVLKFSIELGHKSFDFGRSTIDSGTYRFKKQWGAKAKQLYWYYWLRDGETLPELNPGSAKFKLAIAVWKKLPVPVTKLLGPGIVKNLP